MNIRVVLVLALLAGLARSTSWAKAPMRVQLPSLRPSCTLSQGQTGIGTSIGLWLECGGTRVLLTHPLNLVGHVTINTESDALDFVRLFSSADTYRLFPAHGVVEVGEGEQSGVLVLDKKTFRQCCRRATVKAVEQANQGATKGFLVSRPMLVRRERAIYEVDELVYSNGLYQQLDMRLVAKDVDKLGVIPPPVH